MKLSRFIAAAAGVAALGLSTASFAAAGAYVGVKGGYNNMEVTTGSATLNGTGVSVSTDDYFYNIHAGYLFPVAPQMFLGPQIGYTRYGNYKVDGKGNFTSSMKEEISGINLLLVGQYDFSNQFYLQGRIGAEYAKMQGSGGLDAAGITQLGNVSKNQILPTAGISVGYYFLPQLSGALTYDHLFGKNYNDNYGESDGGNNNDVIPAMDSLGVSVSYHF